MEDCTLSNRVAIADDVKQTRPRRRLRRSTWIRQSRPRVMSAAHVGGRWARDLRLGSTGRYGTRREPSRRKCARPRRPFSVSHRAARDRPAMGLRWACDGLNHAPNSPPKASYAHCQASKRSKGGCAVLRAVELGQNDSFGKSSARPSDGVVTAACLTRTQGCHTSATPLPRLCPSLPTSAAVLRRVRVGWPSLGFIAEEAGVAPELWAPVLDALSWRTRDIVLMAVGRWSNASLLRKVVEGCLVLMIHSSAPDDT